MNLGNDHITVMEKGPLLTCVLNRPDRLNAFSHDMLQGLKDALNYADQEEHIKVVVLSGAGRAFTAGGDVKTMGTGTPKDVYDHVGLLNETILTIRNLTKPVIAGVHGFAAGAGFNLALACDQILCAEDSQFVLSFSQVGLISDGGGTYFLTKLLGPYRTKELLFSAEPIKASRALELGIVTKTVPLEELETAVQSYAERLATGPVQAFGMMKKVVHAADTQDLATILEQERISQTLMVSTEDHQEGIAAFAEKRKPQFTGQ
ncbi:enoyl-CoA hydratase [Pontibacillus halophilus JSM 076056 = DSM 19796]|uniref:Enoyl-CoA hydratase n=1 Tax=Pontibacillus halophilus JSM 076056 = DSM 19796 TaxID=1385510 RepID=A0A0A5I640_9BACI|nr:enoyl-CoA hydratase-related protein [Pontibacillus halophilus]KGX91297.1 enoyl-CoA hydratase [Pontibacillus halophilus JSM 076056 = DSM 19796]